MTVYSIPGFSDPVSSMTHLFSSPIFLIIGIVMIWNLRGNISRTVSLTIFTFAVVFLLVMSGVFHLLTPDTSGRYVLQVLDHAAIFILIAATFTPIHTLQFKKFKRWGILLLVWSTAITGVTLKSIYFEQVPELLSLALYLSLGWLGAFTGYMLYRRLGFSAILPLIYGALAYTLGATLELLRYPILISGVIGPHEIFHIFVLLGISFHWQFAHRMAQMHKDKVMSYA
ncbi:PAQR family membrane homeostasis protein TrhA [Kaarinaea lacus]